MRRTPEGMCEHNSIASPRRSRAPFSPDETGCAFRRDCTRTEIFALPILTMRLWFGSPVRDFLTVGLLFVHKPTVRKPLTVATKALLLRDQKRVCQMVSTRAWTRQEPVIEPVFFQAMP